MGQTISYFKEIHKNMAYLSSEVIDRLRELSCEFVAERLGIDVQKHRALCFMHDDHHPSMSFYGKNRNSWHCFVCNKGGSSIDLVREFSGLDFVAACTWLGQISGISTESTMPIQNIVLSHRKRRKSESELRHFSIDVAEWILENNYLTDKGQDFLFHQRKLSPDVIKQLNIVSVDNSKALVERITKVFSSEDLINSGFFTITNGKMYFRMFTPCLVFPYYNIKRNLIGMQSRYLGSNEEAPRFQFISAQKTRLFNLPILNEMNSGDRLYISEGVTDCLALLSSGKKAVAIPSATILPQIDLMNLVTYNLYMYPDQDKAGKDAFFNLRKYFINHYGYIKEEKLPSGCKDFSEYYVSTNGNSNERSN